MKAAKDARESWKRHSRLPGNAQKAHAEELEKVRARAEVTAIAMEKSYKKTSWLNPREKPGKKAAEARRQAEETARRMDMAADESAVRFSAV